MEPKQDRFVLQPNEPRVIILDNAGEWMSVGMSAPTAEHNAKVLNAFVDRITELEQERDSLRLALEGTRLSWARLKHISRDAVAFEELIELEHKRCSAALGKAHEPVSKEAE